MTSLRPSADSAQNQFTDVKPTPFSVDAHDVVRSLRGALAEVLQSVGSDPKAPQSIQSGLGLNKNLAWKVSRIIQAEDSAEALELMPGSSGIRILLASLGKSGVEPQLESRVREAIDAYERLIRVHSGDRTTLEMLGSVLTKTGRQERDEQHRKLLFQGASYVWGAQARVSSKIGFVIPGNEPGMLEFASVNGFVDFRRLRSDVMWEMARRNASNDDGSAMASSASEAIDADPDSPDGPPLMRDFCSKPLPTLRRVDLGKTISFQLAEGPVGNTGALTCFVGAVQRGIPYVRTPINEWGNHQARCEVPTEVMVVDLFFHHRFGFAIPPEVALFSDVGPPAPQQRLPLQESLQDLGRSAVPPPTPEVPRYRELLERVVGRFGRELRDFHGFRMKIAYPAYPTSLSMRYRLPEHPVDHTS